MTSGPPWSATGAYESLTERLQVSYGPPGGIIRLMIQVIVNGAARRFEAPLNLTALLEQLSMSGKKIAVEKNGEIVPKSAHADTVVADGDQLEIVVAVGGG